MSDGEIDADEGGLGTLTGDDVEIEPIPASKFDHTPTIRIVAEFGPTRSIVRTGPPLSMSRSALLLNRGTSLGNYEKAYIDLAELTSLMAGGAELDSLAHELEQTLGADSAIVKELEKEATEARAALNLNSQPSSVTPNPVTTALSSDR